jgi:putative FmdB family regulatory protein
MDDNLTEEIQMPIYEFKCDSCEEITEIMCRHEELPKNMPCEHCKSEKTYRIYGLGMIKSTYDQNGREAIKINTDGKSTYRSKTREIYEKDGTNVSQYTKGYKEHMKKKGVLV